MFWRKTKGSQLRQVNFATLESIKVAEFYHAVTSGCSLGSDVAIYVAKELNTLRTHEVAEMVLHRLRAIDDVADVSKLAKDMVLNFNICVDDYWEKRHGSRRYRTVPQND